LLVIDRIFFGFPFGNMVDTNINGGSADTNGNGGRGVTNPCGEHGEEDWTDELVMAPTRMGLGFVDGVRINGCAVDGVEEDPDVIRKRMFPSSSNGRSSGHLGKPTVDASSSGMTRSESHPPPVGYSFQAICRARGRDERMKKEKKAVARFRALMQRQKETAHHALASSMGPTAQWSDPDRVFRSLTHCPENLSGVRPGSPAAALRLAASVDSAIAAAASVDSAIAANPVKRVKLTISQAREAHNLSIAADVGGESGM
jgi:hypothetical protein